MHLLVQQLIIGLTNGLVVALIALGYSLVFGVLSLINMAHGDVFMLAAFFALTLMGLVPSSWATGSAQGFTLAAIMLATAAFAAAVAWLLDRGLFRAVRHRHPMAPLVTALGASLALQNVGLVWGAMPLAAFGGGHSAAAPKAFPMWMPSYNVLPQSLGLTLTLCDVGVAVVSLLSLGALGWLVHGTSLGRAMRATAQDPQAARLMGIDTERVIGQTFALGGALAGVGAMVYGLYVGTIHYQMGTQTGLYAFVAAVVGGIGSLSGAVLGGLVIGVTRAICDQYIGPQWQPAVLFGLLIVIIMVRPTGLLGARTQEKV